MFTLDMEIKRSRFNNFHTNNSVRLVTVIAKCHLKITNLTNYFIKIPAKASVFVFN